MANENIKVISNREDIVAIADNIRTLTGVTGELTLAEMATAKGSGGHGSVNLPELTNPASEDEVFLNQEYIDGRGNKKTGTFTIEEELTEQNSLILQLQNTINELPDIGSGEPTLQSKVVTPTTFNQTITADNGYDGLTAVIVYGDTNLIPENIKSGVTIFGVVGTYKGNNSGEGNLITFDIDGTTYNAEDGMTWAEWVDSEYNNDGYITSIAGYIVDPDDWFVGSGIGQRVKSNDQIQADKSYILV